MAASPFNKPSVSWRRVRQAAFAGVTLAFTVAACTDDAIVYPNRNLGAHGGAAGTAGTGPLAAAGEAGAESGGASPSGGASTGGGSVVGGGDAGTSPSAAGASGAANGPVCGNGIVEPPEECDDGNTISGDGCSAQCKSHCETCEAKVCSLNQVYDFSPDLGAVYDNCYQKPTGDPKKDNIQKGPANGVSRTEVCRDLVDCVRREKCGQVLGPGNVRFERCWCDVDWSQNITPSAASLCQSSATFVPGKCASQFQDASETDTLSGILSGITATQTALGRAVRLLVGCDQSICVEECVPEYFGDTVVATITQDLTAAASPAGESQLGDLTADAQRHVAGSDAAIVSPAALCPDGDVPSGILAFLATPNRAADADGRVLWSEALATQYCYSGVSVKALEFKNVQAPGAAIVKATFTGQQLYDALTRGVVNSSPLYVSGLTYTWQDASSTPLRSIVEIRKDGVLLDKAATYTVALSDFLGNVSPGTTPTIPELTKGTNVTVVPNSLPITLFGQYLSQLPQPVSPPTLNRITRLSASSGSGGSGGSGP